MNLSLPLFFPYGYDCPLFEWKIMWISFKVGSIVNS